MRGWVLLVLIAIVSPVHAMEEAEGISTTSLGTSPTWSPDGRLIAYQGSDYNIWVMLSDGTGKRQLIDDIYRDEQPVFSPDGKLLAYVSERGGRQELWIMERSGEERRQMTAGTGWKHSPTWSPDGKRLAFIISPERNGEGDIWVTNLNTGEMRQVTTDGGIRSVSWNHVDGGLAYLSIKDGSYDIHLLDPSTGLNELLWEDTYWKGQLTWSPDGKSIAFVSYRDENYDIWILKNGDLDQVTSKDSWQVSPAWSPDGTGIAYASDENSMYEIWVKEIELVPTILVEENPVSVPADVPMTNFAPVAEPVPATSPERSTFEDRVPVLQLSEEKVPEIGDGEIVPQKEESDENLVLELEQVNEVQENPKEEPARNFIPLILAAVGTAILVLLARKVPLKVATDSSLWSKWSVPLQVLLFYFIK